MVAYFFDHLRHKFIKRKDDITACFVGEIEMPLKVQKLLKSAHVNSPAGCFNAVLVLIVLLYKMKIIVICVLLVGCVAALEFSFEGMLTLRISIYLLHSNFRHLFIIHQIKIKNIL